MTSEGVIHRAQTEVFLRCQHTALYYPAPKRGDVVYCRTCATFQLVIRLSTDKKQLKIKCEDCQYVRMFQLDQRDTAWTKADTHSLRRGHRVYFYDERGRRKLV